MGLPYRNGQTNAHGCDDLTLREVQDQLGAGCKTQGWETGAAFAGGLRFLQVSLLESMSSWRTQARSNDDLFRIVIVLSVFPTSSTRCGCGRPIRSEERRVG